MGWCVGGDLFLWAVIGSPRLMYLVLDDPLLVGIVTVVCEFEVWLNQQLSPKGQDPCCRYLHVFGWEFSWWSLSLIVLATCVVFVVYAWCSVITLLISSSADATSFFVPCIFSVAELSSCLVICMDVLVDCVMFLILVPCFPITCFTTSCWSVVLSVVAVSGSGSV